MTFSTMMDRPLLISDLFEHCKRLYRDSRVITVGEGGDRIATYAEVGERTERLAAFYAMVRDAADGWTGNEPVRTP